MDAHPDVLQIAEHEKGQAKIEPGTAQVNKAVGIKMPKRKEGPQKKTPLNWLGESHASPTFANQPDRVERIREKLAEKKALADQLLKRREERAERQAQKAADKIKKQAEKNALHKKQLPQKRRLVQAGLMDSVAERLTVKNVKAFLRKEHSSAAANEVNKTNMLEKFDEYAVSQITSVSDKTLWPSLSCCNDNAQTIAFWQVFVGQLRKLSAHTSDGDGDEGEGKSDSELTESDKDLSESEDSESDY